MSHSNQKFIYILIRNTMKTLRNKVQLIGNLGTDPEISEIAEGKTVAKLSLATTDTYKKASGEKVTETMWHNLVAWGKTAEIAGKYLKKGNRIAIEGRLVNRSYEDKKGIKRYITEIVVNDLLMLGDNDTTNPKK